MRSILPSAPSALRIIYRPAPGGSTEGRFGRTLHEPAAGLSPAERVIVAQIIRDLPRRLTVILIEHDMDLALGLADYVTCLHNGRVLMDGTPDAIRKSPAVQEVYLGRPRHA